MKSWIASVGILAMAAHAMGQGDALPIFPKSLGKNLNGRALSLPDDFAGRANLVFIAFEMRQQQEVDTCKSFTQGMRQAHEWLHAYELPTIGRGYGLIRGFIDGGMRSGIPDSETRASTITLYLDVDAFARALGIESTGTITILLVKSSGEIMAHASGPYSKTAAAPLISALDAMK
ncbi:MAG: hypothetical protein ABSF77_02685 [Spirochaetia bacterium]|jgi:hypothetical protein